MNLLFVAAMSYGTEIFSYSSPRHKYSKASVPSVEGIETKRHHENFSELRYEILSIIGGATKRLWISTPYLTDGEIASSLFMAKYRKLDVKVLLGRAKANGYMSRLGFLKKQNVPVNLMPRDFKFRLDTWILSDDRLVRINSNLDMKSSKHRYLSEENSQDRTKSFIKAFAVATNKKIPAIPRPTPYVGRPGRFNNVYSPGGGSNSSRTSRSPAAYSSPSAQQAAPEAMRADGSYNYNFKRPEAAPEGMPKKLPAQTIQQKKFREQFKNQRNK
jgi:hypothetical protein